MFLPHKVSSHPLASPRLPQDIQTSPSWCTAGRLRHSRKLPGRCRTQTMALQEKDVAAASAHDGLVVTPQGATKVIHFIRHAVGFHNIGFETNHDAQLTPYSWQQADALRKHVQALQPPLDVEVVIVSPLRRTLETAVGVFGGDLVTASNGAAKGNNTAPILMVGQTAEKNTRTERPAMAAAPGGPPFIACELCRERMGSNRCDSRQNIQLTKAMFPGVDFSLIENDEDVLWPALHLSQQTSGMYAVGESEAAITARGVAFMRWLLNRPETRIAVVSHAGFIKHTLAAFASDYASPVIRDSLAREFLNCELRTVILADVAAAAPLRQSTNFPGGSLTPVATENGSTTSDLGFLPTANGA